MTRKTGGKGRRNLGAGILHQDLEPEIREMRVLVPGDLGISQQDEALWLGALAWPHIEKVGKQDK